MTCKIIVTTRTAPGYSHRSDSPLEVVARCETHNMPLDEPCHLGCLCPIGKIEAATEMALDRIRNATFGDPADFPNPTGDHGC